MRKAVFKSTVNSLKKYDGFVDVISELDEDEYSKDEVGQMWLCESNGERFSVFDDELTFEEKVEESWEEKNMRANAIIGIGPSF